MADPIQEWRVLVTGGAGFIGSHLVDYLLLRGAERVVIADTMFLGREENLAHALEHSPDRLKIYREDCGDRDALGAVLAKERPSIVFNLATRPLLYSFQNPAGAFDVNVRVALTVAEALRLGCVERLVHVSSSEVFGSAQAHAMDESHVFNPETSYAAGKAAADLLFRSYVSMFALPILILRPFNNFGPRQNEQDLAALIPATIRRIREGEAPVIEGDGKQTRDFAYVKDTVRQIVDLSLKAGFPDEFNLGTGEETSVSEVISLICNLTGYAGPILTRGERVADVKRHRSDTSKVSGVLPQFTSTPLKDALEETVQWFMTKEQ